jgi:hypothetical protein
MANLSEELVIYVNGNHNAATMATGFSFMFTVSKNGGVTFRPSIVKNLESGVCTDRRIQKFYNGPLPSDVGLLALRAEMDGLLYVLSSTLRTSEMKGESPEQNKHLQDYMSSTWLSFGHITVVVSNELLS